MANNINKVEGLKKELATLEQRQYKKPWLVLDSKIRVIKDKLKAKWTKEVLAPYIPLRNYTTDDVSLLHKHEADVDHKQRKETKDKK